ncbi:MAG: hypothetical protein JXL81_03140 [Deltaproteobacteria bacterium]|nr:hypothetical protein [Deltaproteobacteria bacterium]
MKCPLCGYEFSPDEAECKGCAINKSCKTICCPHCGYRTVEKSGILSWIKKVTGGDKDVTDK